MDNSIENLKITAARLADKLGVSVVFLPERIMRRVIRKHRRIPRYGGYVPHARSYQVRKALLKKLIQYDPADLERLKDRVILLSTPEAEELPDHWLWRTFFHEQVHSAFHQIKMTPTMVRERIHQLGQVEFDEIRYILRKEDILLPARTPSNRTIETYGEFLATWLELQYFQPDRLANYFPGLASRIEEVSKLLHLDVEAAPLFENSRPEGAVLEKASPPPEQPDPLPEIAPVQTSPHKTKTLRTAAIHAAKRGNRVRAFMALARAGESSESEIQTFSEDLERLTSVPEKDWAFTVEFLLEKGGGRRGSSEAKILYDLQNALLDHERPPHKVDIIEPILQWGKVSVRRPLPSLKHVLPLKHFNKASKRSLPNRLIPVFEEAIHNLKGKIRDGLRPQISTIVSKSGLHSGGTISSVAIDKMVEELLDTIIKKGFFTFGELRDAVARNQARLRNLSGPGEFFSGDPLLQLDHSFRNPMEGVYERGDIYLRWLQKVSSLFFGTTMGRLVTRFAILPFGGAFVLLEGLQHMVGPIIRWSGGQPPVFRNELSWLTLGIFLMGVLLIPGFRTGVWSFFKGVHRAITMILIDAPTMILRVPFLTWLRKTWGWIMIVHFGIRPLLVTTLLGWPILFLEQDPFQFAASASLLFFLVNIGLNTLFGRALEERVEDVVIRSWKHVSAYLIPNLFHLILEIFRIFLETIEMFIYRVDELLRFRPGDPRISVLWKAFLGAVWFYITYFIRIYITVLVEPQVNPIKHFPVVTVSHKIILPLTVTLVEIFRIPLSPLGPFLADSIAVMTVFLLPGMFGFLVWEFKENWRLYRANRPRNLSPVVVGSHGESVARLLRPGIYSGTIPRAFSRLRKAQRKGKPVEPILKSIHHIEESISHFVDREFIQLLKKSRGGDGNLSISKIHLSSNRIRILMGTAGSISFEDQSGWLIGSYRGQETDPHFHSALEGLYKLAGVELVRNQIEKMLPPDTRYDISLGGITCWPATGFSSEFFYPLKRILPVSKPRYRKGDFPEPLLPIRMRNLVFRKKMVSWKFWEDLWEEKTYPAPNP